MDITALFGLTPPVLLMLVLNLFGLALKRVPAVPDWLIPLLLPVMGAIIHPFVGDYSDLVKAARFPWVYMALYGFGIGWAAVGANQALRQFLGRNETNETTN